MMAKIGVNHALCQEESLSNQKDAVEAFEMMGYIIRLPDTGIERKSLVSM